MAGLLIFEVGRTTPVVELSREVELSLQFAGTDAGRPEQAAPGSPTAPEPTPQMVASGPSPRSVPAEPPPLLPEPAQTPVQPLPPPDLSPVVPDAPAPPPEPTTPARPEPPPPAPPKPVATPPKAVAPPPKAAPARLRPVSRPQLPIRLPGKQAPEAQAPSASPAPAANGPATAIPSPAAPPGPEVTPGWRGAVSAWLQSHKTYPDEARERGEEGNALVRFTVDRSGRVLEFALIRGTGSASLDAAVGRMLTGAQLPAFPSAMTQDRTTVTVQVRYALR